MNDLPKGLRVLIIDDDEPVRRILVRIMGLAAFEVITAEHGMAGLKALENDPFDMVVTDLKMPGANGLDVARWVHEHKPSLPVVVISGFATVEDAARIAAVDALLLRKPFTPQLVHDTLRKALVRKR